MRWLLLVAVLLLSGCEAFRQEQARTETTSSRTVVVEKRQVEAKDGAIIQLTTRTETISNAKTGEQISEATTVDPPQVLREAAKSVAAAVPAVAQTVATAMAGPAAGEAAGGLASWAISALTGTAGLGVAGALGSRAASAARRREAEASRRAADMERQRDELCDGIESAKDHMDPDTWKKVRKTLYDNQSDDTVEAVRARTA